MNLDSLKVPVGVCFLIGIGLVCIDAFIIGATTALSYIGFFGIIGVPVFALLGAAIYNWVTKK